MGERGALGKGSELRRIIGALLILLGIGLTIAGGLGVAGFGTSGTLQANSPPLQTSPDSYAIVADIVGVDAGFPGSSSLGEITIGAETQSAQQLFVGYALRSDVNDYLAGVGFDAVAQRSGGWETRVIPGVSVPGEPAEQDFWLGEAVGSTASVQFAAPTGGDISVVVMNSDVKPGVTAELFVGYESDVVFPASVGSIVLGAVLVIVGLILVIRRAKPSEQPPVPSKYPAPEATQTPSTQATEPPIPAESQVDADGRSETDDDSIPSDWLRPGSEK